MNNWSVVLTFTYPQDVYMAKNYLESEGIETLIRDELTAQVNNFYSNAIGGVKLLVRNEDLERSIQVLREGGYIHPNDMVEEEVIELVKRNNVTNQKVCPFCGSENIGKKREPDIIMVFIYFVLGVLFPLFKPAYKCFSCSKVWKYKK